MFARIKFWDHTILSKDLAECAVFGEIISADKKKLLVRVWQCLEEDLSSNDEFISILISSVIKIDKFEQVRSSPHPRKRGRSHGLNDD